MSCFSILILLLLWFHPCCEILKQQIQAWATLPNKYELCWLKKQSFSEACFGRQKNSLKFGLRQGLPLSTWTHAWKLVLLFQPAHLRLGGRALGWCVVPHLPKLSVTTDNMWQTELSECGPDQLPYGRTGCSWISPGNKASACWEACNLPTFLAIASQPCASSIALGNIKFGSTRSCFWMWSPWMLNTKQSHSILSSVAPKLQKSESKRSSDANIATVSPGFRNLLWNLNHCAIFDEFQRVHQTTYQQVSQLKVSSVCSIPLDSLNYAGYWNNQEYSILLWDEYPPHTNRMLSAKLELLLLWKQSTEQEVAFT